MTRLEFYICDKVAPITFFKWNASMMTFLFFKINVGIDIVTTLSMNCFVTSSFKVVLTRKLPLLCERSELC